MDDDIVFIEGVDVINVGPKTKALIVVRVVATHDQAIGQGELAATTLPEDVDARPPAIPGDLVTLDNQVLTATTQAHLAVVMDEITDHLAIVFSMDAHTVVQANFIVSDRPALIAINCPTLNW